ncbi:MAG: hypothetical protein ABII00_12010 [Elusimicrobiota bacterium]
MSANGAQLAYQYLVGGAFFFVTLWLCFRLGGAQKDHPQDRKSAKILLIGFAAYFCAHTLWIVLAGP